MINEINEEINANILSQLLCITIVNKYIHKEKQNKQQNNE